MALVSTGTARADSADPPDQGANVVSVFSGYVCSGTIFWRDLVQGDGQAQTVGISEALPIVSVRLGSAAPAALVSAVFSGTFLSAAVTISQGATNYVWSVCSPDTQPPLVTIDQAVVQADPTGTSPILFDVEFSEPVTGFTAADVVLSGTAGATTADVTGSGATYEVAVRGMTGNGTVVATIPAGAAVDAAFLANTASGSSDNEVTYAGAAPPSAPPSVGPSTPTAPPSDSDAPAGTTDQSAAMPLVLFALAAIGVTLLLVPRRRPR
jgi:hypothetical protein